MWLTILLSLTASQSDAPVPRRAEPVGSPASWVTHEDYPAEALARDAQGTVHVRVSVDATGRPARCEIERSSGDEALDTVTCEIFMTRGRFRPAEDASGQPVADTYASTLTWRIEDDTSGGPFETEVMESTLRSSPSGELICNLTRNGSPIGHNSPGQCGFLTGSGADRILRSISGEAEISLLFYVIPEGQELVPSRRSTDEVVAHKEVEVTILPEGAITDCIIVSTVAPRSDAEIPAIPDPCSFRGGGNRPYFAPVADGRTLRRARIGVTLFMRRGRPL